MGFYVEHVLPRLIDRGCAHPAITSWRAATMVGLEGRVVEIGFGSGLSLEHLPAAVDLVLAVEPAALARRLARRREAAARVAVEHVGLDGTSLSLADASVDGALSTFTLCTIPDAALALAELRRVLRPGGRFHFLEHGLAPDRRVVAWQRRLEPLQRRLAGGCHLTRDVVALVTDAGFELEQVEQAYADAPKPWAWFTRGVAVNPGPAR